MTIIPTWPEKSCITHVKSSKFLLCDSSVISKSYLSEPYNNNIEQVLVTRVEKLF